MPHWDKYGTESENNEIEFNHFLVQICVLSSSLRSCVSPSESEDRANAVDHLLLRTGLLSEIMVKQNIEDQSNIHQYHFV